MAPMVLSVLLAAAGLGGSLPPTDKSNDVWAPVHHPPPFVTYPEQLPGPFVVPSDDGASVVADMRPDGEAGQDAPPSFFRYSAGGGDGFVAESTADGADGEVHAISKRVTGYKWWWPLWPFGYTSETGTFFPWVGPIGPWSDLETGPRYWFPGTKEEWYTCKESQGQNCTVLDNLPPEDVWLVLYETKQNWFLGTDLDWLECVYTNGSICPYMDGVTVADMRAALFDYKKRRRSLDGDDESTALEAADLVPILLPDASESVVASGERPHVIISLPSTYLAARKPPTPLRKRWGGFLNDFTWGWFDWVREKTGHMSDQEKRERKEWYDWANQGGRVLSGFVPGDVGEKGNYTDEDRIYMDIFKWEIPGPATKLGPDNVGKNNPDNFEWFEEQRKLKAAKEKEKEKQRLKENPDAKPEKPESKPEKEAEAEAEVESKVEDKGEAKDEKESAEMVESEVQPEAEPEVKDKKKDKKKSKGKGKGKGKDEDSSADSLAPATDDATMAVYKSTNAAADAMYARDDLRRRVLTARDDDFSGPSPADDADDYVADHGDLGRLRARIATQLSAEALASSRRASPAALARRRVQIEALDAEELAQLQADRAAAVEALQQAEALDASMAARQQAIERWGRQALDELDLLENAAENEDGDSTPACYGPVYVKRDGGDGDDQVPAYVCDGPTALDPIAALFREFPGLLERRGGKKSSKVSNYDPEHSWIDWIIEKIVGKRRKVVMPFRDKHDPEGMSDPLPDGPEYEMDDMRHYHARRRHVPAIRGRTPAPPPPQLLESPVITDGKYFEELLRQAEAAIAEGAQVEGADDVESPENSKRGTISSLKSTIAGLYNTVKSILGLTKNVFNTIRGGLAFIINTTKAIISIPIKIGKGIDKCWELSRPPKPVAKLDDKADNKAADKRELVNLDLVDLDLEDLDLDGASCDVEYPVATKIAARGVLAVRGVKDKVMGVVDTVKEKSAVVTDALKAVMAKLKGVWEGIKDIPGMIKALPATLKSLPGKILSLPGKLLSKIPYVNEIPGLGPKKEAAAEGGDGGDDAAKRLRRTLDDMALDDLAGEHQLDNRAVMDTIKGIPAYLKSIPATLKALPGTIKDTVKALPATIKDTIKSIPGMLLELPCKLLRKIPYVKKLPFLAPKKAADGEGEGEGGGGGGDATKRDLLAGGVPHQLVNRGIWDTVKKLLGFGPKEEEPKPEVEMSETHDHDHHANHANHNHGRAVRHPRQFSVARRHAAVSARAPQFEAVPVEVEADYAEEDVAQTSQPESRDIISDAMKKISGPEPNKAFPKAIPVWLDWVQGRQALKAQEQRERKQLFKSQVEDFVRRLMAARSGEEPITKVEALSILEGILEVTHAGDKQWEVLWAEDDIFQPLVDRIRLKEAELTGETSLDDVVERARRAEFVAKVKAVIERLRDDKADALVTDSEMDAILNNGDRLSHPSKGPRSEAAAAFEDGIDYAVSDDWEDPEDPAEEFAHFDMYRQRDDVPAGGSEKAARSIWETIKKLLGLGPKDEPEKDQPAATEGAVLHRRGDVGGIGGIFSAAPGKYTLWEKVRCWLHIGRCIPKSEKKKAALLRQTGFNIYNPKTGKLAHHVKGDWEKEQEMGLLAFDRRRSVDTADFENDDDDDDSSGLHTEVTTTEEFQMYASVEKPRAERRGIWETIKCWLGFGCPADEDAPEEQPDDEDDEAARHEKRDPAGLHAKRGIWDAIKKLLGFGPGPAEPPKSDFEMSELTQYGIGPGKLTMGHRRDVVERRGIWDTIKKFLGFGPKEPPKEEFEPSELSQYGLGPGKLTIGHRDVAKRGVWDTIKKMFGFGPKEEPRPDYEMTKLSPYNAEPGKLTMGSRAFNKRDLFDTMRSLQIDVWRTLGIRPKEKPEEKAKEDGQSEQKEGPQKRGFMNIVHAIFPCLAPEPEDPPLTDEKWHRRRSGGATLAVAARDYLDNDDGSRDAIPENEPVRGDAAMFWGKSLRNWMEHNWGSGRDEQGCDSYADDEDDDCYLDKRQSDAPEAEELVPRVDDAEDPDSHIPPPADDVPEYDRAVDGQVTMSASLENAPTEAGSDNDEVYEAAERAMDHMVASLRPDVWRAQQGLQQPAALTGPRRSGRALSIERHPELLLDSAAMADTSPRAGTWSRPFEPLLQLPRGQAVALCLILGAVGGALCVPFAVLAWTLLGPGTAGGAAVAKVSGFNVWGPLLARAAGAATDFLEPCLCFLCARRKRRGDRRAALRRAREEMEYERMRKQRADGTLAADVERGLPHMAELAGHEPFVMSRPAYLSQ